MDVFELYGVNTALELFYIGVDSRYQKYGIARNLLKSTIDMIKDLALIKERGESKTPEVIYGIFTSNYSQSLAEKFEFEWLHTLKYDEYKRRDGKTLSEKIGNVHQCAKFGARRLRHK